MAISNFPLALQPIIQQGWLEHAFQKPLMSKLGYRAVADREAFPNNVGETVTKTRDGLLPAATTPMNSNYVASPSLTAATLDNGMTPVVWPVEQYTLGLNAYGNTMNLNVVRQKVGIVDRFVTNARTLGENAYRTVDNLARNALYGSYIGGNTRVRSSVATVTLPVDDVRGFLQVWVSGVPTSVSPSNPLAVTVNGTANTVVSAVADSSNVSTTLTVAGQPNGISGVLTLGIAVSSGDGTAGNAVVAATAPKILRPNSRTTSAALTGSDTLTMGLLLDAATFLRNNAVPDIDGLYNAYTDPTSMRQLFGDTDFKQLFQGATNENGSYAKGVVEKPLMGLRFVMTNETPVQPVTTGGGFGMSGTIRRPIVCGMGALVEGDFDMAQPANEGGETGEISVVDGIRMVTRAPLDRLQEEIAQSWEWIGGFCAPTDTTTSPLTIGTATNAAYKRAVIIEHAG